VCGAPKNLCVCLCVCFVSLFIYSLSQFMINVMSYGLLLSLKKKIWRMLKKKLSWLRLVPVAHIHTDRLRVIWYDVWWLQDKLFSRESSFCSRRRRITDYRERITQIYIYIYIMIVYFKFKKKRCWNVPEASGLCFVIFHIESTLISVMDMHTHTHTPVHFWAGKRQSFIKPYEALVCTSWYYEK